jgi:hypothetical protein
LAAGRSPSQEVFVKYGLVTTGFPSTKTATTTKAAPAGNEPFHSKCPDLTVSPLAGDTGTGADADAGVDVATFAGARVTEGATVGVEGIVVGIAVELEIGDGVELGGIGDEVELGIAGGRVAVGAKDAVETGDEVGAGAT